MQFSPVNLSGGPTVFVKNVVERFREVQELCAREDQGPNDHYLANSDVVLREKGDKIARYRDIEGDQASFHNIHGVDNHDRGERVSESFRYSPKDGLVYQRQESTDGLKTMNMEWIITPTGTLETRTGQGSTLQGTGLGETGLENAIIAGFPQDGTAGSASLRPLLNDWAPPPPKKFG